MMTLLQYKHMMRRNFGVHVALVATLVVVSVANVAYADQFSSTNYKIDASVGNSLGGDQSSTNYRMTSSGGEALVGTASSTSYALGQGYVAQLTPNPSIQVNSSPSGLVAQYSLDEAAGVAAYDSGVGGYTATAGSAPTRQTGKIGGAVGPIGLGSNQWLQTSETTAFDTSNVTVCSWVYRTASATNPTIVSHSDASITSNGMWLLAFGNGQRPRFIVAMNSTTNILFATNDVSYNSWNHICGTYDGVTQKIYVNGVLDGSASLSGSLPAVSTPLTIGARSNGSTASDNQYIDEIKVYNRALRSDEILAEYTAQNAGIVSGISLGTITAGASETASIDVAVKANVTGYSLAINQDHDLQSGGNTVPAISSPIASPATWSEGATKGLGFTMYDGPTVPAAWSAGSKYAAIPGSATSFYTQTGHLSEC